MIKALKKAVRRVLAYKNVWMHRIAASGFFDEKFTQHTEDGEWRYRIAMAKESADNHKITKVTNAGVIKDGKQTMHNGIQVYVGSYYGKGMARLLTENRGVHEPQEEYAFQEVLPYIKTNGTMIEMGSYWAFYSIWFQQAVPHARNYLMEPDLFNLKSGQRNFSLNKCTGQFFQYAISDKPGVGDARVVDIETFSQQQGIPFIDMLHSDIQGHELIMLKGAAGKLAKGSIGYLFISTHSNELHLQCLDILKSYQYIILAEANLDESFSVDGLIVARHPHYPGPVHINISKRKVTI